MKRIAAQGPDESRFRLHVEEPDAVGAFMCGLPPAGTQFREPHPADPRCEVCDWLASPEGLRLASEGRKGQARKAWE